MFWLRKWPLRGFSFSLIKRKYIGGIESFSQHIFLLIFFCQKNYENMETMLRTIWIAGRTIFDFCLEAEKQPYWICLCCYGNCSAVYPWMLRTFLWLGSCWAIFWQTLKFILACDILFYFFKWDHVQWSITVLHRFGFDLPFIWVVLSLSIIQSQLLVIHQHHGQ